ncbi:D-sedoheptulose-7-phosphate isomerase [Pseudoflavonifractor phocaeensis]|uniref:D-sedoheptulose-7-phosphate isomerase n=1 Tax=Pseudoflavonifractor phocaeensis TaxID=1870988 RepID=UPI00195E4FDB|nr:SIS domain-containing protein [Pseudoflavonifractor phocaeensis]MBM6885160.1 SIS domain-containing protein [Pseudoflavonifractor phocaeensis]
MNYTSDIQNYIALEIEILNKLDVEQINAALNLLNETRQRKGRIYICGNGGSAATASHFQNDFNKGVSEYIEVPFRFHCLNDNVATLMAIANDIGYEEVFRFQLRNNLEENDVLVAISGSGNSPNVIHAVEYAKEHGCKIIGLTGFSGGKLKELSDISLHAPVNSMQVTEDIHMIFDHLMMSIFYKYLCGKEHLKK